MRHCQILRNERKMAEEKLALRLKALTGKIKTIKSEVLHGGYCDWRNAKFTQGTD